MRPTCSRSLPCKPPEHMAEARPKPSAIQHNNADDPQIELGLNAAIVTVRDQQPHILVVRPGMTGSGTLDALPFGPFAPRAHRTLEIGLREWVKRQTGLELGYVEQLYTFAGATPSPAARIRSRSAISH